MNTWTASAASCQSSATFRIHKVRQLALLFRADGLKDEALNGLSAVPRKSFGFCVQTYSPLFTPQHYYPFRLFWRELLVLKSFFFFQRRLLPFLKHNKRAAPEENTFKRSFNVHLPWTSRSWLFRAQKVKIRAGSDVFNGIVTWLNCISPSLATWVDLYVRL